MEKKRIILLCVRRLQSDSGGDFIGSRKYKKLAGKYFKRCEGVMRTDENGEPVMLKGEYVYDGKTAPTVTGLALALGFNSRAELLQNCHDDADLQNAVSRVEEFAERQLFEGSVQGAKFCLVNNFEGWDDKKLFSREESAENNLFEMLAENDNEVD